METIIVFFFLLLDSKSFSITKKIVYDAVFRNLLKIIKKKSK